MFLFDVVTDEHKINKLVRHQPTSIARVHQLKKELILLRINRK